MASIVVFAIAFGAALAAGTEPVDAVAIGAFCTVWGGPGFGCMMGAVSYMTRTGGFD